MNKYQARYKNALKKAARVNRFIKKGYHVFYHGELIKNGSFILRRDQLLFKSSETVYIVYFENNSDCDHGYWTSIEDYNQIFSKAFEIYKPTAKVKI